MPPTNEAKADGRIGRRTLPGWKFRPYAVGLIALALSIFLWSSAYKFSRLEVHQKHSARVYMAKMWLETRSTRAADIARRVFAERPPNPSHLSVFHRQGALANLGSVEINLPRLPSLGPVVTLLPSRAPPLRRFCLA